MIEIEKADEAISVKSLSDQYEVRTSIKTVMDDLAHRAFLPEERGTVELVLAEVLNNIAEHAYEERPDGAIQLTLSYIPGGITVALVDFGKPMPNGQTPLGMPANLDVEIDNLPEGGFGWFLIGELAKDLLYERRGAGNYLSFRMSLGDGA